MTIGLDIDGTITRHPQFFAFLSHALRQAGHEVIVITFRQDRQSATADLATWGIACSRLVTWSLDERTEMEQWKGAVCRKLGVEIMMDDDPDVLRRLDPDVLSVMVVDHDAYDLARLASAEAAGGSSQFAGPLD